MKYLLFLIFLISLPIKLWGNGGGYHVGVDFTGSVSPFSPTGTEKVQILDEKLDIVLHHQFAEVSVRYLMHNTSRLPAKVKFGFPVEDVKNDWMGGVLDPGGENGKKKKVSPLYCKDYEVRLNGDVVRSEYLPEEIVKQKLKSFPGSERFKGIEGWMVSQMSVPGGKNVVLEIRYKSYYDVKSVYVSDDGYVGPWVFKYRLSTGGVWAGPIKQGVVTISLDMVSPDGVEILKPANQWTRRGDVWTWKFQDLEPTLADDIKVIARPDVTSYAYNGIHKEVRGYEVRKKEWFLKDVRYTVKASSELPATERFNYKAENVKGGSSTGYAWSEGVKGQGIAESLTLTLKKPRLLYAIKVYNGYNDFKNEIKTKSDLFYQNSRIKEATLLINGKHKVDVTLLDHPDAQWLRLDSFKGKISTIKLVINSVYPGSQFQDTCVSGIVLVEKLKSKPKQYGCR